MHSDVLHTNTYSWLQQYMCLVINYVTINISTCLYISYDAFTCMSTHLVVYYYFVCALVFFNLTDINECLNNNGGCSHNCTNTVGSYYCECSDGYVLQSNQHDCEGEYILINMPL